MPRKRTVDLETKDGRLVDIIVNNVFSVLPLLRKRLIHLDTVQEEHGIPLSHVQVLTMLFRQNSMSVSEISRKLGIAKPNITPLVDRLIEQGYVERVRDTEDRRVVNVLILPQGREKLSAIHDSLTEQVSGWSREMTASDFEELANSLANIARILSDLST